MRFKSIEEAKKFGFDVSSIEGLAPVKKGKSKREIITSLINNIRSSHYEFDFGKDDSYVLTISGFAAPSWNKMTRMDYRMYSSYSKALKQMIINAGFAAKALKKYNAFDPSHPVSINVHCERRYLLDLDNVCAKQIIDGIVACGIIKDDKPQFVKAYHATQEKAKKDKTIITIKRI